MLRVKLPPEPKSEAIWSTVKTSIRAFEQNSKSGIRTRSARWVSISHLSLVTGRLHLFNRLRAFRQAKANRMYEKWSKKTSKMLTKTNFKNRLTNLKMHLLVVFCHLLALVGWLFGVGWVAFWLGWLVGWLFGFGWDAVWLWLGG